MKTEYKNPLRKIIFLSILCYPFFLTGQITFQNIYTAPIHESGKDVLQTPDGGYIIAASTETSIVDDLDIMIVRTNNFGDTLWRKKYGGNLPDSPNGIIQASDGNYFIIGYTQSFGSGDYDYYLLKINPAGDTLFSRVYGGYGNEEGKEIISTSDGNYMIVGASNSLSFSDNNMQLIKIDSGGNILWTQYYGGLNYESARSVKQCADGGYIVAGKTINASGVASIYLVRTNPTGDTTWTKTIGAANSLEGKSILVNADGSYTLSVDDSSGTNDSDVRIMKFDPLGNVIWSKLYSGSEKDITKMIQSTSDGGYIVTALSRSFGWIEPDYWVLKLDPLGDTLWTRHFGGDDHEHCYAVRQTTDGGYIVVGHTRSNNIWRIQEIMLIKLNSNGELGPLSTTPEYALNDDVLMVYPNPSAGIINISLSGMYAQGSVCKIMNTMGQLVFKEEIDSVTYRKSIHLKNYTPGMYYITIQSEDHLVTKKLVLN